MNSFPIVLCIIIYLSCLVDLLLCDKQVSVLKYEPLIINLINGGKFDSVYDLISKGENPNEPETPSGWTPLIYAATSGNLDLASHLILGGADVNIGCADGWTPLMFACVYGKVEMIQFLINHGANVHQVSFNGATALGCSKLGGYPEAIKMIEDALHLAKLNEIFCDKNGVESVILSASHAGNVELVQKLLVEGHDPNTVSFGGWTPLMLATAAGSVSTMQSLVNAGAQVDYQDHDGWTALMFAAHSGRSEEVEYLVTVAKADILLNNNGEDNAIDLAYSEGYTEVVRTIIENSFCSEMKKAITQKSVDRIMTIINYGADASAVCDALWDYNPLIIAVKSQDAQAVETLISLGADVNAADRDQWTPLMFAALRTNERIIKLLLKNGADRDLVTKQGYSVLRLAQMYNGENDVILGMLENGIDFTESPSVYEEKKENNDKMKMKDMDVNTIKASTDDDRDKSAFNGVAAMFDVSRRPLGSKESIQQYPPATAQGDSKSKKSLLSSLFGWLL